MCIEREEYNYFNYILGVDKKTLNFTPRRHYKMLCNSYVKFKLFKTLFRQLVLIVVLKKINKSIILVIQIIFDLN